ncbi:MAG: flagellin FliC [Magnetococcales bacterium]|nr:flagellin FliC [Magnetococcales bacterium]
MSIIISSNASSLRTANTLSTATRAVNTSYERLASGLRINQAKDDVAGFSISTRMEVKLREQNQVLQNVGDAISMTQIADSGLREGSQIMQRMQELAVQAANDTYPEADRQSMEDEFQTLNRQLEHLATYTEFNGQKLLDGSMSGKKIQVGGANHTLEWLSMDGNTARLTSSEAVYSAWWSSLSEGDAPSILSQSQAEKTLGDIGTAITNLATQRTRIGAFENRLRSIQDNLLQAHTETSSARSKIRDADVAQETALLTSHSIIQNATTAILAQANQQPTLAMKLFS